MEGGAQRGVWQCNKRSANKSVTGKHAVRPARHQVCSKAKAKANPKHRPDQLSGPNELPACPPTHYATCPAKLHALHFCECVSLSLSALFLFPSDIALLACDSFIALAVGHSAVRPSGCPAVRLVRLSVYPSVRAVAALKPHWHGHASRVAANQFESSGAHVKKPNRTEPKKHTTNFIFIPCFLFFFFG